MKINFQSHTELELLGHKILDALREKFPESYFVGGFVRDILLGREVNDIDIATSGSPDETAELLEQKFVVGEQFKKFGVIVVKNTVEVASFRTETYSGSRYPQVRFGATAEEDSQRRDFTINGLYMSAEGDILDFHGGIGDIGAGLVKFIGDPETRIKEDPLRILRAIRFALQLEFKIDAPSAEAITKNFPLAATLNERLIAEEAKKLSDDLQKKFEIIINSKALDENLINSL